jgi:hypothetical protein
VNKGVTDKEAKGFGIHEAKAMSETMNPGIRGWGRCLYVDDGEGRVLLASASIKQQVLGSPLLLRTQERGTMNDQGRSW